MKQAERATTRHPDENWAGDMGTRWLAHIDSFEGMIAPIGDALLDRAKLSPGDQVVDIGCGGGLTTLAAARAIGPRGRALGVDISPALIARATERARISGLPNVEFRCADAEKGLGEEQVCDRMVSRFGSMFFSDPYAAFANLTRALKPKGQLGLAVWAAPRDNVWMSGMVAIVRDHIELARPDPRAPGPFAFEEPEYLTDILHSAGLHDIAVEPWEGLLPFAGPGASKDRAVAFALEGMVFRDKISALDEPARATLARDLRVFFEAHHGVSGVLMPAKAWLVSATAR